SGRSTRTSRRLARRSARVPRWPSWRRLAGRWDDATSHWSRRWRRGGARRQVTRQADLGSDRRLKPVPPAPRQPKAPDMVRGFFILAPNTEWASAVRLAASGPVAGG